MIEIVFFGYSSTMYVNARGNFCCYFDEFSNKCPFFWIIICTVFVYNSLGIGKECTRVRRQRNHALLRGRIHGCQMAIGGFLDHMCLALWASGLWLCYAALQNLIPSFPWIVPPPTPFTLTQSKKRKGSNFAIWQPWHKDTCRRLSRSTWRLRNWRCHPTRIRRGSNSLQWAETLWDFLLPFPLKFMQPIEMNIYLWIHGHQISFNQLSERPEGQEYVFKPQKLDRLHKPRPSHNWFSGKNVPCVRCGVFRGMQARFPK